MKLNPLSLVLAGALVLSSIGRQPAMAADDACIVGSAPEVAADGAQISAVRALVEGACPCLGLWDKPSDYAKCAKGVIKGQLEADELRRPCARILQRLYAKTICGKDSSRHYAPCIETSLRTGKIKCGIKAYTERDGQTPTRSCDPTDRAQKVRCPDYTNCIDAADVNHDLKIGAPGDNGGCVPSPTPPPTATATVTETALPLPTSTSTSTSTATPVPTHTPTSIPTNTPLGNGATCFVGTQCASGQCVDGVCCDSACSGSCLACTAATKGSGVNGVCGTIASGSDPDGECSTEAAATCGRTGTCDGAGACALHPGGTICGPGVCLPNSIVIAPGICNGAGSCTPGGGGTCSGDSNPCTTDGCSGGICTYTNNSAFCNDGVACTINDQCGGGACAGTQIAMDLQSGITHEIPYDGVDGFVHLEQQIVTVTSNPFQLTLVDATSPPGFDRESLESNCIQDPLNSDRYRCTHDLLWRATTACEGDGTYQLSMQISCSPSLSGCGLCNGTQEIEIGSDTSNWCD